MVERLFSELFGNFENQESERKSYEFFRHPQERKELFNYSLRVTKYIHDNEVADLVIIDRSSRPLYIGVRELWDRLYPDEPKPGIYFLNPNGFKPTKDMTRSEIDEIREDKYFKDDTIDPPKEYRDEEDILEEFQRVYSKLNKDREKPILVFDSCIHSGDTLGPIRETLTDAGFEDVRIGSINPAPIRSWVDTDYYITEERPDKGCYPFDRERMIEKTFDHVYSSPNRDPYQRERAVALREEVKEVVTSYADRYLDSENPDQEPSNSQESVRY